MENEIDGEILIALVEARPLLWDKGHVNYKDRNDTKEAWDEICAELDSNYETYGAEEKFVFSKAVMKRWVNIRDSYNKYLKKEKQQKVLGPSASTAKKYIYATQLEFLNNTLAPGPAKNITSTKTEIMTSDDDDQELPKTQHKTLPTPRKEAGSRQRMTSDNDMRFINILEKPEDRHICFFKGILPTLHTFTEDQVLLFQMNVLQTISDIKKNRNQLR